MAFGEPFGCLSNSKYHPWVKKLPAVMKGASYMTVARIFSPLDKIMMKLISKKTREGVRDHRQMATHKVQGRIAAKTDRRDFWSYILKPDEPGMTPLEMEFNGGLLVIAGSETTATALAGTTYALCKNHDAMKLLQEDVRGTFKNEKDITMVSVGKLKYLYAVLLEGMRLYPPVPNAASRYTPAGGEQIAGSFIPGGVSTNLIS